MHGRRLRDRAATQALFLLVLFTALVVGLGLAACSSSNSGPSEDRATGPAAPGDTQKSEGGQVTVKVTWQGADAGPVFTVVMDTHSVDLDGIDLRDLAMLRTNEGREARATGWDAAKGGHHREGTLTFPPTATDGNPLISTATETITLTIRDVAGVAERSFQWSRRISN